MKCALGLAADASPKDWRAKVRQRKIFESVSDEAGARKIETVTRGPGRDCAELAPVACAETGTPRSR